MFSFACNSYVVSTVGISASARTNNGDTYLTYQGIQNSGGTPYTGPWRGKWDYSSTYIYNYGNSGGTLKAWVNSAAYSSGKKLVDRWYSGKWGGGNVPYNGPSGAIRVGKNEAKFLHNYCREDYYRYSGYKNAPTTTTGDPVATVGFIMNTEGVYYKIAWSPDSVGEY